MGRKTHAFASGASMCATTCERATRECSLVAVRRLPSCSEDMSNLVWPQGAARWAQAGHNATCTLLTECLTLL